MKGVGQRKKIKAKAWSGVDSGVVIRSGERLINIVNILLKWKNELCLALSDTI
jgi:hypothetical protein